MTHGAGLFPELEAGSPQATEFADVALGLPMQKTFQYSVPGSQSGRATVGKRVFVNVRNRRMVGYVVGLSTEPAVAKVLPLDAVIDEAPILTPEFLELTRWMAEYYFCSWGQAIEAALPAPFKRGRFLMKSRSAKAAPPADALQDGQWTLTSDQDKAYRAVSERLTARESATFLLHGITGSGKTEVYMHLIRDLLKADRGSIVLVPEISLTPQTVERFHSRFGEGLAVIHSRLSQARRVEEWHRIRSGEAKVVVGARSAVFSPVKDLGLIVIDEEQESSYKQDETPRYEARRVASKRCELERAVLLLGSATPSLEAYHETENNGPSKRLVLSERIEKRPLPLVEIVDMRTQHFAKGVERIFSTPLELAVKACLERKEQSMLLLNRRGFSTYLHCSACGYVAQCPNCRIGLAYHWDKASLYCHLCEHRSTPVRLCPGCQKNYLHYFGIGTQKVEQEAAKLFPDARIARMDSDSTSKKDSHETILRAFRKREIDILIGTQMIAKGHDFPNVSLIGVISADTALHIPDFRAAERTFDLLTQVAGRAGRGDIPGRVIVQTHVPHHYAIKSAKDHDYLEFYEKEIRYREELMMPPFSHLVRIVVTGKEEKNVVKQSLLLAKFLGGRMPKPLFDILGPAPCAASKEAGNFRWNVYLKAPRAEDARPHLEAAIAQFARTQVQLMADVDPQ